MKKASRHQGIKGEKKAFGTGRETSKRGEGSRRVVTSALGGIAQTDPPRYRRRVWQYPSKPSRCSCIRLPFMAVVPGPG